MEIDEASFQRIFKKTKKLSKELTLKKEQISHYFRSKISRNTYVFVDSRSELEKNPLQFISLLLINGGSMIGIVRRNVKEKGN